MTAEFISKRVKKALPIRYLFVCPYYCVQGTINCIFHLFIKKIWIECRFNGFQFLLTNG